MNKGKILLLGMGQFGNRIINLMLEKDGRYSGLFCNASMSDMENLNNFDINRNVFHIPNATGTGKSRDLAKKYIKEEVQKLIDIILKYKQQSEIFIFASADGGFGSGSLSPTIRAIKRACPEKSINVVAVFPTLSEGDIAFKNTIEFWNDLINLKTKNLIDSIQIIDNNKRKTFDEINECVVEELDYALGFSADTIDETDSKRINTDKGYKVILKLDDKYKDIESAIDNAIQNSVFLQPKSFDCNYLGVSVKKDSYNPEEFRSKFDSIEAPYCGYNDEANLILLSGLDMPKDGIEIIQMALKDIETRKRERKHADQDLLIKTNEPIKDFGYKKEKSIESKSTISSRDLNKLFDDNFWDD